ncbi:hypothetical protein DFAR_1260005 [Desulfarculales bacterium]
MEMLGSELVAHHPVRNHDCRRGNALVGRLEGQVIEIAQLFLAVDLKILTALIELYTFAGFFGSGKTVRPSPANLKTMELMHSYRLVAEPGLASGRLHDNPFQQYIRRVVGGLGVDCLINAVIDYQQRFNGVFAGDWLAALQAGCRASEAQSLARLDQPTDLVITSGGGHPLGQAFFHANKGFITARGHGAVGGWLQRRPGRRRVRTSPAGNFHSGQLCCPALGASSRTSGASQRFFQAKEHFSYMLLFAPDLTAQDYVLLGMTPISDLQVAVDELCGRAVRVTVISEGSYLVEASPA